MAAAKGGRIFTLACGACSKNSLILCATISTPSVSFLPSSTSRFYSGAGGDCTTSSSVQPSSSGEVSVHYRNGLPVVTLPLPSRRELCQFTLKPISHTIGDFCNHIRQEDHGIDVVVLYTEDGIKLANSTQIQHLLQLDRFQLRVNDQVFLAEPPRILQKSALTKYTTSDLLMQSMDDSSTSLPVIEESVQNMDKVQALIGALYSSLNVDEYQRKLEQDLAKRLEELNEDLEPLKMKKKDIDAESGKRADRLMWLGLGAMGIQFGAFARLTWWEYSWDIMEPVTYFATYGTVIGGFIYYLLTKQSYDYPEAKDRLHLFGLYKGARKCKFDIDKYNRLIRAKSEIESDLRRLRDPLFLHLPLDRVKCFMTQRQSAYNW